MNRTSDGSIEIKTHRMKMVISVDFDGFAAELPDDFEELYLGLPHSHSRRLSAFSVGIAVRVQMKRKALLTPTGWHYYDWVDSFLDELEDRISEGAFFGRLNWDSAGIVLRYLERARRKESGLSSDL